MSLEIATRWYKAPEVLFGSKIYDHSVDIWAAGCVFAQLIDGSPLFPGGNDIQQLFKIIKVLGTPTKETWPDIDSLPDFSKVSLPQVEPIGIKGQIQDASQHAVDLIEKMLSFDPKQRISAKQALQHEYFKVKPDPCQSQDISRIVQEHIINEQKTRFSKNGFEADYLDDSWFDNL